MHTPIAVFCLYVSAITFAIQFEMESNSRWIAEIGELPGVMVYGATQEEAKSRVEALALRVLADRIETESLEVSTISFAAT